jgi:hypothetical protein
VNGMAAIKWHSTGNVALRCAALDAYRTAEQMWRAPGKWKLRYRMKVRARGQTSGPARHSVKMALPTSSPILENCDANPKFGDEEAYKSALGFRSKSVV